MIHAKKVLELIDQQKIGTSLMSFTYRLLYCMILGGWGGFLSWFVVDPLLKVGVNRDDVLFELIIFGGLVGLIISMSIGAVEGLVTKKISRGILGGGLMGLIIGAISLLIANEFFKYFDLPYLSRAIGWGIFGSGIGAVEWFLNKTKIRFVIGTTCGFIGGVLGGLIFDYLKIGEGLEITNRAVALTILGIFIGLFIGFIPFLKPFRRAMIIINQTRQHPIFGKITTFGSNQECNIFLPKDNSIAPRHFCIVQEGGSFFLETYRDFEIYLNKEKVKGKIKLPLKSYISVGKYGIEFISE